MGDTAYQLDCPVYRHAYANGSVDTFNQITPTEGCPVCTGACAARAVTSATAAPSPSGGAAISAGASLSPAAAAAIGVGVGGAVLAAAALVAAKRGLLSARRLFGGAPGEAKPLLSAP